MTGRPLVACLSALVLCAWLAGGSLSTGPNSPALDSLVRWVMEKGADQTLASRHAVLIGLNHAHASVRAVWLGRERAPDGLKRAIAIPYNAAYNPDGSGMEPVAIILFLLDVDRCTARGGFVSGDIYLAHLDGELVKASGVDREFDLSGREISYAEMPFDADSRNIRRDFRRELAFWLQDSVRPRWERP